MFIIENSPKREVKVVYGRGRIFSLNYPIAYNKYIMLTDDDIEKCLKAGAKVFEKCPNGTEVEVTPSIKVIDTTDSTVAKKTEEKPVEEVKVETPVVEEVKEVVEEKKEESSEKEVEEFIAKETTNAQNNKKKRK